MNPILAAVLISLVPALLGAIGFNIAARYLSGDKAKYRSRPPVTAA